MLGSENILCWSDNVFGSGLLVRVGLLDQEAFSAVCSRVEYLDAMSRRLVADKGFGFLLLELINYAKIATLLVLVILYGYYLST